MTLGDILGGHHCSKVSKEENIQRSIVYLGVYIIKKAIAYIFLLNMAVTEVTSPPPERAESTASVLSELKKQSSDVNIIKEYKDMFSKEKSDKSDLATDQITDVGDAALDLLKTLIEEAKSSCSKDNKKWNFQTSPHKHFDKTLDDTYKAFLSWARLKQDTSKVNVSKAFRRLESYAVRYHHCVYVYLICIFIYMYLMYYHISNNDF